MNAIQGWKDNEHSRFSHRHIMRGPWPPYLQKTYAYTYYLNSGTNSYLDAKSMRNAWWVMMMWRCELDKGAPYGSLRPCHYLVTPLTSTQREEKVGKDVKRKREWGSPKTTLQLKLSGVNSAIITLKCQPAIKYNSSSGRKQISFDHAVITLSCRTIRRDQIFTFSVWGKAIRVHSTWQGCTFAILQG